MDGENSIFDTLTSNRVHNVCVKSNKLFVIIIVLYNFPVIYTKIVLKLHVMKDIVLTMRTYWHYRKLLHQCETKMMKCWGYGRHIVSFTHSLSLNLFRSCQYSLTGSSLYTRG